MGESDQSSEREQKLNDLLDEVNAKHESIQARASRIYGLLREHNPDLTNWDLLCFAAEYAAYMSISYPWLNPPARDLARSVYLAHYLMAKEILEEEGQDVAKRREETS
jgi:hypothetical protein